MISTWAGASQNVDLFAEEFDFSETANIVVKTFIMSC